MFSKFTYLIFLLPLLSCYVHAQEIVASRVLKEGLFIPWEIVYGPDDHLWFTQKNGYLCRMDTAGFQTDTLLHEPGTAVVRESGMLGMAIHPYFQYEPYIYVAYTYFHQPDSAITLRIVRYTYNHFLKQLNQPKILLDDIRGGRYHNGCRLLIAGNKLYITVGDATDTTLPQNIGSLQGKVLRIELDGAIPPDNPISNSPIWSWGHRNAQGLTMANGKLYASEHGPNTDDEVNIIERGSNYGWPFVRGFCDSPYEQSYCESTTIMPPLRAWTPCIAPCGIEYYNYAMFPSLRQSLLMTTLKDAHLYSLKLNQPGDKIRSERVLQEIAFGRLRDVCVSPDGRIYLSTSNSEADGKGPFIDKIVEVYNPYWRASSSSLLIYPDPAQNEIYVSPALRYRSLNYSIVNVTGQIVLQGTITPSSSNIVISHLLPGIYFIALFNDTNELIATSKFAHTY